MGGRIAMQTLSDNGSSQLCPPGSTCKTAAPDGVAGQTERQINRRFVSESDFAGSHDHTCARPRRTMVSGQSGTKDQKIGINDGAAVATTHSSEINSRRSTLPRVETQATALHQAHLRIAARNPALASLLATQPTWPDRVGCSCASALSANLPSMAGLSGLATSVVVSQTRWLLRAPAVEEGSSVSHRQGHKGCRDPGSRGGCSQDREVVPV
jgi:hypothetical protein